MKRAVIISGTFVVLLLAGTVLAGGGHPNLTSAHSDLISAQKDMTAAQVANEYKLGGHAARAKALIDQAEAEMAMALKDAEKPGY
jgi:hypothetical protein